MKTTASTQKEILSIIKSEISKQSGIKSIIAFLKGFGNPDCVSIDGNKISVRVSHKFHYLVAKDGY